MPPHSFLSAANRTPAYAVLYMYIYFYLCLVPKPQKAHRTFKSRCLEVSIFPGMFSLPILLGSLTITSAYLGKYVNKLLNNQILVKKAHTRPRQFASSGQTNNNSPRGEECIWTRQNQSSRRKYLLSEFSLTITAYPNAQNE